MPCSICAHPEVTAIAAAVSRGDSLRTIEAVYKVNKSSVSRHVRQCLNAVSVASQAANTVPTRGYPPAPAHLVNAVAHHQAMQLAAEAMRCYETGGLRHVVRSLAELVAQIARDTETTAPQADEAAKRWNRL